MFITVILLACLARAAKCMDEYDVFYGDNLTISVNTTGRFAIRKWEFGSRLNRMFVTDANDGNTTRLTIYDITPSDADRYRVLKYRKGVVYTFKLNVKIGKCNDEIITRRHGVAELHNITCFTRARNDLNWTVNDTYMDFIRSKDGRFNIINKTDSLSADGINRWYHLLVEITNYDDVTDEFKMVFIDKDNLNFPTDSVSVRATNPMNMDHNKNIQKWFFDKTNWSTLFSNCTWLNMGYSTDNDTITLNSVSNDIPNDDARVCNIRFTRLVD